MKSAAVKNSMTHDLKFKSPFTCIISGLNGSGKSSFFIRFLQNFDSLCPERHFDGGITWCYSERAAVPSRQLAVLRKHIRFIEGVPENFDETEGGRPCLVNLDHLLNDVSSKKVCALFTKDSHHRNIRVNLITQNLFHEGRYCRDISLIAKYLVLLRDKNQFMHMVRQVYPEHRNSLYRAYLHATHRLQGYFILDLSQDTNDLLRFGNKVFPNERPPIIYAPVGDDEASEIELSYSPRAEDGQTQPV